MGSFPRVNKYNQGRVPLMYPLLGMHESTQTPGAENGSQVDHKQNIYAIQTRKLSQYKIPQDYFYLDISFFLYLRACLHGGGGPQVGEVARLAVVEN